MIYYILILISVILLAFQFAANKKYQTDVGSGVFEALLFSVMTSFITFAVFFVYYGFKMEFTPFSFWMNFGKTVGALSYWVLGMKLLKMGKMAIYMLFLMLGGWFFRIFSG